MRLDGLVAAPRAQCKGAGRVPYTTSIGFSCFLICSCVRWDGSRSPDEEPGWIGERCDAHGVLAKCLRCNRELRLTSNGLRVQTGETMARRRAWARDHWECPA